MIEIDDKLPDDITLKNVVILIASTIKNGNKFYLQIFLEETSVAQKASSTDMF